MIYLVYFAVSIVLVVTMTLALVTGPNVRWRVRARRQAELRRISLLRSWLTPEQATRWSFAPEDRFSKSGVLLAQKIALETMEQQVVALANTQASRP
jgi:hypothetical protein